MNNPFPSYYEEFIYKSRYSRWLPGENRRENWDETVRRYCDFFEFPQNIYNEVYEAIYNLEVMPSMRCLMTAGPALHRNHIAAYNCAYLPISDVKAFKELFYILMHGTGVGYSVERRYVEKLPQVPITINKIPEITYVADSKEGWVASFNRLVFHLLKGEEIEYDVSGVRPAGAPLKTFGGRASGPGPLVDLFEYTIKLFHRAKGRKLTSLEVHDLCCKIAEIVVVGGVRRSAMISLSDLDDPLMRDCKQGAWYDLNPERALANNSAVYNHKPSLSEFFEEWHSLFKSRSGERGIFNRAASQRKAEHTDRSEDVEYGTNPCSEIILKPYEFCNLSEMIIRADDSLADLRQKARIASILGTYQSQLTNFKGLRRQWKSNCDEERLLGVSMTGIYDTDYLPYAMLKEIVKDTNELYAIKLGIPSSKGATCVKPSGTVSQLVNSASGLHPRHSEYYIRTVRADNKDPLTRFLKDQGVPSEPDLMKPDSTTVFSFPIKSPDGAVLKKDLSAEEHLQDWLHVYNEWCEHKPSVTVYLKDDEWFQAADFVWKNFDDMAGVSFLPDDGGSYKQAPYQECTEEYYQEAVSKMPEDIDWNLLTTYELDDHTTGTQEFACTGGVCEIVSIGEMKDG